MSLNVLFWILMLAGLFFIFWEPYVAGQPYPFRRVPGYLLIYILLGLLGWAVFGAVVKGGGTSRGGIEVHQEVKQC